jgi:dTDP-4-amino-4,6-dideoxygalactose transaminase
MNESFAAIHSFYPTKPLGCRGDGGAIISNDETFINKCKKSRFYGLDDGEVKSWGFNSRMDEWQSAFLSHKVAYYRENNRKRQANASKILSTEVKSVKVSDDCVFHQLVTLWRDRDSVASSLAGAGIPTMIHYPKMLSDMPWLQGKVNFVPCNRVSDHILSLPVGPHLTADDVELISQHVRENQSHVIRFNEI